jgi:hypothetical protein
VRKIAAIAGLTLGLAGASAEDRMLEEKLKPGEQIHHRIDLAVSGKMTTDKGEQPLSGRAALQFPQRVLEIGKDGLPSKVLRYYGGARAKFNIAGEEVERTLRPESRMMVGERGAGPVTLWALAGPITADERELVEDVMDATRIAGLLPKGPVKVGDQWNVDAEVAKGLCNLEVVAGLDISAKVATLTDDKATIKIDGKTEGSQQGGHVKMTIDATLTYDVKAGIVEKLEWTESDVRASSPIAPAGTYHVKLVVTRDRSIAPNLTDQAVEGVDLAPKPDSKLIVFEAPNSTYKFVHDRHWFVTAVRNNIVVMRCVKNNEFLGQMSIALLNDKAPGNRVRAEDFEKVVEQTTSAEIDEIERTDDVKTASGVELMKLTAKGSTSSGKVKLVHRHYLATTKEGKQMMFSFLLEPHNEKKFGDADERIVASLEVPTTKAAAAPTENKSR